MNNEIRRAGMKNNVVVLAGRNSNYRAVCNAIAAECDIVKVIVEDGAPLTDRLLKRIKRMGMFKVTGQVLFVVLVVPLLRKTSRRYVVKLKKENNINDDAVAKHAVLRVASVNSREVERELKTLEPDVVLLHGTRIISEGTLNSCKALFVNIHAGITPLYRGAHGAYWALVNKDKEHCGVTLHVVDAGIDTGPVIDQARIVTVDRDNFVTYPVIQLISGLEMLKKFVRNYQDDTLVVRANPAGTSKIWSHPTLFEYLWHRMIDGIK